MASKTARNIIVVRGILQELGVVNEDFTFPLLIDNMGSIVLSSGEKVTKNSKHVDIRYHHIRDLVEKGTIQVSHISTREMAADGLTKTLTTAKFREFRDLIGISRIMKGICYTSGPQNDEFDDAFNEESNGEPDGELDGETDGDFDEEDTETAWNFDWFHMEKWGLFRRTPTEFQCWMQRRWMEFEQELNEKVEKFVQKSMEKRLILHPK